MSDDININDDEENQNMVPEDALKRRLAEQTRKHQKELRRKEEELALLRRNYEQNQSMEENPENQVAYQAAQNVISGANSPNNQSYISEDRLPEIFEKYDRYKQEQEERRRDEERQRRQIEGFENARKEVATEIGSQAQNDPELREILNPQDDNKQLPAEIIDYLTMHSPKKAPKILKKLISNDSNLSKIKDPSVDNIIKSRLINEISSSIDADKLASSVPQMGGEFAINRVSEGSLDPNKITNTQDLRKYYKSKSKYKR